MCICISIEYYHFTQKKKKDERENKDDGRLWMSTNFIKKKKQNRDFLIHKIKSNENLLSKDSSHKK